MSLLLYTTFSSTFDDFTIIWKEVNSKIQIQRMFLSDSELHSETKARKNFAHMKEGSSVIINEQGEKIQLFLKGKVVDFDLAILDFNLCSEIQEKVLIAEYNIPRGWVSTYKRIANHIRITNGARVVGNSLARNPFPIFIPCHRAIKSNGELGGYQGGLGMKRKLLEMEGILISEKGKVVTEERYY